jgi:hypothetical protein
MSEASEQRADGEHCEPDHEQSTTTEQIGQSSAEQQHTAEEDRVCSDDPLQALLGEVQVVLDGRECNIHDRHVEDDHELGGDDHG